MRISSFQRLAIAASGGYSAVRSASIEGGSGYAKYLYSPRPKPCLAMTTRLRKGDSDPYMAAMSRHCCGVSSGPTVAHPCSFRCTLALGHSTVSTPVSAGEDG